MTRTMFSMFALKLVQRLDRHENTTSSDSLLSNNLKIVSMPNNLNTPSSGPLPGMTITRKVDQLHWRPGFVLAIVLVLVATPDTLPTILDSILNLFYLCIPLQISLNPSARTQSAS